jgi:hypothetical protein
MKRLLSSCALLSRFAVSIGVAAKNPEIAKIPRPMSHNKPPRSGDMNRQVFASSFRSFAMASSAKQLVASTLINMDCGMTTILRSCFILAITALWAIPVDAEVVLQNLYSEGVQSTAGAANIWFRTTAAPQDKLVNQLWLFGDSGQTVSQTLNIYQGLPPGFNILPSGVQLTGQETNLGGYSKYAFTLPDNLIQFTTATYYALELRDLIVSGNGFYASNSNSAANSTSFNATVIPGNDFNQQFQGENFQFQLVSVPEPSTYAMALAGLACGGYTMFRRRRAR